MPEQNPKIQKWLDIGKKRFADKGAQGININEMSEEIGVAKTSFYFFFSSKEEYLNQLFAYWVVTGTTNLIAMVNQINDPGKRFLALGKMIESNFEGEFFYFQLKLYSRENKHGRKFLEDADRQRVAFSTKIFKDAGQSDEQAEHSRRMMKVFTMGTLALKSGYDSDPYYPELTPDKLLKMFGLDA